jgi:proteic killer suppression protein
MIRLFKHKGLREFFETNSKRGIPPELSGRLRDRLDVIDAAASLEDIALPHFGLHELKGDRRGDLGRESQQELAPDICFCGRRCQRGKL